MPVSTLIYSQIDLPTPELHKIVNGFSALYTACSPDKPSVNEDAIALISNDVDTTVIIVADGMGGGPAGEQAAAITVRTLAHGVTIAMEQATHLREAILDGIEKANREICTLASGAGATLIVAEISQSQIRSYHVGDAAMLITGQRGRIKLQTISHSPVSYAVEAGLIDESEAVHHEDRNLVSNALGSADIRIEVGPQLTLAPKDTVLLCSDGLLDNLYIEEIIELIRKGPLEGAAKQLLSVCNERMATPAEDTPSHPDDLSFVLFRLY